MVLNFVAFWNKYPYFHPYGHSQIRSDPVSREDKNKKPSIVVANDVSRVQGAKDRLPEQSRETHETQMHGY